MNTIDRINRLIASTTMASIRVARGGRLHDILNALDSAIGAHTEWLPEVKCRCPYHINGACGHRRAVGARVQMLEEIIEI